MILAALLVMSCSRDEIQAKTTNYETMTTKMYITIDGRTEAVTLTNNSATQALVAKLQEASVTVTLNSSGGFEIWGALGFSLPTSNEHMFYGTNSWNYTLLGKIDGLSESELRTFLKAGESNISVTLSLALSTSIRSLSPAPSIVSEGSIYSLNGQKVTHPSNGIYIKNGKKVIL